MKRFSLLGVALVVSLMTMVVGFSPSASAAGCRYQKLDMTGGENGYVYSGVALVPSWSTCNDINITTIQSWYENIGYCAYVRIRFYPSSGGNYANGWSYMCDGSNLKVVASNVANGTRYRVEVSGTTWLKVGVYD
jgi:hypothetical protein